METSDQFKHAEEEYGRLRASLASGQLTQEQFDAAARHLIVQDAQGQYWALDDNGYWVRHEGAPPSPPPRAPTTTGATAPRSALIFGVSKFPLIIVLAVAAACLLIVCGLGVVGLALRPQVLGSPVALAPTSPPTATVAPSPIPTDRPAPTDVLAPAGSQVPTDLPTLPVPTAVVIPTQVAQAPTITASPSSTATAVAIAPGIYVTGVRIDPPVPARKQNVQFYVTFLNTTGAALNTRLVVFVFKPDNQKNALGQTTENGVSIVPGQGELKSEGWKLNGGGGCESFLARVASIENKKVTYFNTPDGRLFEQAFSMC